MSYKIEKWYLEVFPGKEKIYKEYQHLKSRELVIVTAAVFDIALAELLNLRLLSDSKEKEDFLGLDQDGRAPCGSFGARVQLAYLVGIITKQDLNLIRKVKILRNHYAHTVVVKRNIEELNQMYVNLLIAEKDAIKLTALWSDGFEDGYKEIEEELKKGNENAQNGVLLSILVLYQAYFDRLREKVVTEIKLQKNA